VVGGWIPNPLHWVRLPTPLPIKGIVMTYLVIGLAIYSVFIVGFLLGVKQGIDDCQED